MRSSQAERRWADEHSRRFNDYYGSMRGYIRREVTRENLSFCLADFLRFPRHVIDVGGGEGDDALWLARQGHEAVLVEPNPANLEKAYGHLEPELEAIIAGTAGDAIPKYGTESFDLVLSHGVLPYIESPQPAINQLASLTRHGGYVSILASGLYGKIERFKSRGEEDKLQQLLLTRKYINELGLVAQAYLPGELEAFIANAGLETVGWYGVRIYGDEDSRPIEEVDTFHRNTIIDNEMRASRDPAIRPQGQMLHYIARKNT